MENVFFIKNMVCDRCIKVLKSELSAANIHFTKIELGRANLAIDTVEKREVLEKIVQENGFLLLDDKNLQLVEQVKLFMITLLERLPLQSEKNLSEMLSEELHRDYSKISRIFSHTEKITLEKYFIRLKMEKVKELIQAKQHNFTEISQLLNYSNLTHLSKQFKNETGMSLTFYKQIDHNLRNSLDQII